MGEAIEDIYGVSTEEMRSGFMDVLKAFDMLDNYIKPEVLADYAAEGTAADRLDDIADLIEEGAAKIHRTAERMRISVA